MINGFLVQREIVLVFDLLVELLPLLCPRDLLDRCLNSDALNELNLWIDEHEVIVREVHFEVHQSLQLYLD